MSDRAASGGHQRANGSAGSASGAPARGVSLATVIDNAGLQILQLWAEGSDAGAIRVSPGVYQAIAHARAREVRLGYPLLLLDLDLIADPDVDADEPVVLRG